MFSFRVLAFQLEELESCYSFSDIRQRLKSIPKDLGGIYEWTIDKIEEKTRARVLNVLSWLAFSFQPLTVEELVETGVVDLPVTGKKPRFHQDGRLHTDLILGLCSGIVSVNEGA